MSAGQFRKKPVVIEASQWHKNGDHPDDYSKDHDGLENGELRVFTAAERKAKGWEGDVVRYFRHPDVAGDSLCEQCGQAHHVHGWIDTLEMGHRVCPGDWIITGVKGERYPCKPDIFEATYESAATPAQPTEARSLSTIGDDLARHIQGVTDPAERQRLSHAHSLLVGTIAQPTEAPPLTNAQAHAVYERWRDTSGAGIPDLIRFAFEEARAQPTEVERDAARYRWLRDVSVPPHNFYISVPDEFHGVRYKPADVDAYIDAARAALSAEGGGNAE